MISLKKEGFCPMNFTVSLKICDLNRANVPRAIEAGICPTQQPSCFIKTKQNPREKFNLENIKLDIIEEPERTNDLPLDLTYLRSIK